MTKLLTARVTAERLGVSVRSLDRWVQDAHLNFPHPEVIRRRRYWDETTLEEWRRNRQKVAAAA